MPREDVVARLRDALDAGDELALAVLLHPEVRMLVDAGDSTGADARGRAAVAGILLRRRARRPDDDLLLVHVNGGPGLALRQPDGVVVAVLVLDCAGDGRIDGCWLSTAPAKLAHWNRGRPI